MPLASGGQRLGMALDNLQSTGQPPHNGESSGCICQEHQGGEPLHESNGSQITDSAWAIAGGWEWALGLCNLERPSGTLRPKAPCTLELTYKANIQSPFG